MAFVAFCSFSSVVVTRRKLCLTMSCRNLNFVVDAILLEVIMPQGTGADEIIYIAGDFNGGQDAASGDLKWQMEKAANNDVKWGIYLYPEDFC